MEIFKKLKPEDARKLGLDTTWARPEWLVVSVLPVPPLHVRPSIHAGGNTSEDDLTHQLINVVKANIALKESIARGGEARSEGRLERSDSKSNVLHIYT